MNLVVMRTEPKGIAQFVDAFGEPTDVADPLVEPRPAVLKEHRPPPQRAATSLRSTSAESPRFLEARPASLRSATIRPHAPASEPSWT
jgi:hypothetical protein